MKEFKTNVIKLSYVAKERTKRTKKKEEKKGKGIITSKFGGVFKRRNVLTDLNLFNIFMKIERIQNKCDKTFICNTIIFLKNPQD